MQNEPTTRAEVIARLRDLIKDIKFAMLTTVETDGTLRSRPMAVQETEFDGDLWFFTEADAPKVDDIQHDRQVNVTLASPGDQRYVSLSGTARLVRNLQKQRELWSEPNKIWFPDGPEDPNLALLRVTVKQAEYWVSGDNRVGRMIDFARAMITGDERKVGENQKVDL